MRLSQELVLFARLCRAFDAWAKGRITEDTFDAIHSRIKAELAA